MNGTPKRIATLRKSRRRRELRAIVGILTAVVLGSVAAATEMRGTDAWTAAPADPTKVLGNASCVKCHAAEQAVWEATPHARTFDQLHRRPEAAEIAAKLGVASVKHGDRCVACHYTRQQAESLTASAGGTDRRLVNTYPQDRHAEVIAGVSCESCHGPARDWLDVHHDYGGPGITRLTETAAHRAERIARSVALGMRNPHNVYLVAQSCYRCHTSGDEELVNVGGHSPGSLDFEFVAWSQGTVHHNFVRSDGKSNLASSPERLRFMFVAGIIADAEASLRAVASATVKDTYALAVAKRAARAGSRLKSVAEKVGDPRLTEAVAVFDAVAIKLNHSAQLLAAANRLATLGYEFAELEHDPSRRDLQEQLKSLDRYLPERQTWK